MKQVEVSIGSRSYPRALECLKTLRAGCVEAARGAAFNSFLEKLRLRFNADGGHAPGFWSGLVGEGVGPVHTGEDPGAGLGPEEAEGYLRVHTPGQGEFQLGGY